MKIAFVSVRGIPNNYGGFEQFAEYISVGLVKRGHEVTVYSPSAEKVTEMLDNIEDICAKHKKAFTDGNVEEIKNEYSWEHLVDQHEEYFKWLLEQKNSRR